MDLYFSKIMKILNFYSREIKKKDYINPEESTEVRSSKLALGDGMKKFSDIEAVRAAKRKYVVYQNQVLDVEGFEHPGSQELIEDNLGKDVTEMFDRPARPFQLRSQSDGEIQSWVHPRSQANGD